ncbi:MAG: GTPase, partial [Gaiellales bacterium]|nr:GTPase [Gaiellales bacterium]
MSGPEHRSGLVALAGRPNAGKSTLVNRLVGEHVAAVSRRPQTTRRRALGAVAGDGWQLVLVDLPGFQKPFDRLTERMQRSVDETLADADAVVLMLNGPEGVGPGDRHIAARAMREGAVPCLIAINKVDRMRPGAIAEVIVAADALGECHAIHPISALTGDGVEPLLADLVELLEQGPAYFPPGVTSDQTSEVRIGEAIREAALEATRDEVPHAVAVLVEEVTPARRGPIVVRAVLICETE